MPITTSGRYEQSASGEEGRCHFGGAANSADIQVSPLQVVLFEPEIPQNAGNVARTCAATRTPLHMVEPLGFQLTDRHLKRAGLDYWPHVMLTVHPDLDSVRRVLNSHRWVFFSSHAKRLYYDFDFEPGDCLVFGPETRGLPREILESSPECVLQIPMDRTRVRSLNLATVAGSALFEAFRQIRPKVGLSSFMSFLGQGDS